MKFAIYFQQISFIVLQELSKSLFNTLQIG